LPERLFFAELKRRRVFHTAAVYIVGAVAALQGLDVLANALFLPEFVLTFAAIIAVLGLPTVIALSWVFVLTPDGVKRQDRIDRGEVVGQAARPQVTLAGGVGLGFLVALVGLGVYARLVPDERDVVERSLAVLPFANLSDEADNEYFSDGIAEDILTKLAMLPELRVISRASALGYKRTTKPIPQVARELGVALVLQGSVRRAGERVRITVQLTRADTDEQLWADSYDRELADVLALQTEIAERITRELRMRIGAEGRARLAASITSDVEAYDLILRGRHYLYANYRSSAELIEHTSAAIALFRHALERDARSATATAWLARAYGDHQALRPEARRDSALALARRAVALDPEHALARLELARAHATFGTADSARHHLDAAIRLNPSDGEALALRGRRRAREEGDYVAGIRDLRRAIDVDPGVAFRHSDLASLYMSIDAHDAAERAWRDAFERIAPHPARLACHLGSIAIGRGRIDEAVRLAHRIVELQPDATFGVNCAGHLLYKAGRELDTARAWFEHAHSAGGSTYDDFPLVVLRARAGEVQQAEQLIAAIDFASQSSRAPHLPASQAWRTELAAYRGDYDEVARLVQAAVREGRFTSVPLLRRSLGDAALDPAVAAALDSMSTATAGVRAQLAAAGLL
jgi:TolB-like protein/Tfp pilus assembly protein PilF